MTKKADRKLMIIAFLRSFLKNHHFMPSIREICKFLEIKSTSLVEIYLNSLVEDGIIGRENKVSRAIWFIGEGE